MILCLLMILHSSASYSRDLVEGGKGGSSWREGLQDGQSQAKKSEQKQKKIIIAGIPFLFV